MSPANIIFVLELFFSTTTKDVNTFDPQPKMIKAGETIEQTIKREDREKEGIYHEN